VLNHSLSWSTFVNTHLYHSRQWFNIHIAVDYKLAAETVLKEDVENDFEVVKLRTAVSYC